MNTELFAALSQCRQAIDQSIGTGWIVGGAVRDMLYGKECKDIDILFLASPRVVKKWLASLASDNPLITDIRIHSEAPGLPPEPSTVLAASAKFGGVEVQFLCANDGLAEAMRRFDWNVCQFALMAGPTHEETVVYDPLRQLGQPTIDVPVEVAADNMPKLLIPADYTKDPAKTLYRGFRFQEKLGLPFDKAGLVTLLTAAKMQAAKAEDITRKRLLSPIIPNQISDDLDYVEEEDTDPRGINCVYRREYA